MNKFKALKTAAFIFEILAYINLLTIGIVAIIYIIGTGTNNRYFNMALPEIGIELLVVVFVALFYYLLPMSIANFLRLQIAKYEITFENLQVSRDILRELKSGNVNSKKEQSDFEAWKLKNPDKTLNDYYIEKSTKK